ncbi:MAG: HAD family hydrolase [Armatimonadota bacterium]|jgi:phosphoglycolate phosphatase-like HAD superfamily hydrolase
MACPGTGIEVINQVSTGQIRSVLFDFDGTLSLIREGWQHVMVPMMVELLLDTPKHESEVEIQACVSAYVEELTGKQTIYQMLRLCEEIQKRGGLPKDPIEYKRDYLARLWERIKARVADLESGAASPDGWLVPGARPLLEALTARGVILYLASGTDHADVLREAAALGVSRYFGERIYGALDRYWEFSKEILIGEIIRNHGLHGPEFAGFGDGFVEIGNTKAAGGIAIGVASDEKRKEGINEWKRQRLIRAGADLIIPDFRQHEALMSYLWGAAS